MFTVGVEADPLRIHRTGIPTYILHIPSKSIIHVGMNVYIYIHTMHGSYGNWIHSHQGPTRGIHDLSQTEVCPISMDQVAMLALQLNVPKVVLGWSCFLITESDTVSFVVFKLTPPYPLPPRSNRALAFRTMLHFHVGVVLEGWSFGKSHEKNRLIPSICHHPVAPTFLVQSQGLGDWSHLWLDLGFTLQSCLLVSSLTKPGDSEWSSWVRSTVAANMSSKKLPFQNERSFPTNIFQWTC